jgi:hypothetical protein
MFVGAINYRYPPLQARLRRPEDRRREDRGVAFVVHDAFDKFIETAKTEYLTLIDQPTFEGDKEALIHLIEENFTTKIGILFPDDQQKLTDFHQVFEKGNVFIRGSNWSGVENVNEDYKQLIAKSITFIFDQPPNVQTTYITTFLDESLHSYEIGDRTSCPGGIVERYILSIGKAIYVACTDDCDGTYQDLNKLFNPQFSVVDSAKEWWADVDEEGNPKQQMTKDERKANFIEYLTNEARKADCYNEYTRGEIEQYADNIDYSFADLALGGSKRKTRTRWRKTRKAKKTKTKKTKKTRKTKEKKTKKTKKTRKTRKTNKTKKTRKTRKTNKTRK